MDSDEVAPAQEESKNGDYIEKDGEIFAQPFGGRKEDRYNQYRSDDESNNYGDLTFH
ncbi:hypothetical protein TRIP_C60507 [Candidatus Zixiibacteriota bacterium]|nr:hypothetical protein TRIP_C60507 [candidate division Zixibacteria bacterium]